MSCIFCDIINKKLEAEIVFENDKAVCFLPKKMEVYGHLLVVPKVHYTSIFDIEKDDLYGFISVVQDIARYVKERLGATGVNILNANGENADQSVYHLHFHILPRFKNDDVDAWPALPCPEVDKKEILKKLK